MTWLTFETARVSERESIFVCVAKSVGYMAACIFTTAILELAILGPLPKEGNDG